MHKLFFALCLPLFLLNTGVAIGDGEIDYSVLAKGSASWDGSELPAYRQGKPEISIVRVVVPPGMKLPSHKHPAINAGVLLSGELTVVSAEGAVLKLHAGDPIIELVDKWHFGMNSGNEPAVIIVFYAGLKGEPLSIKE